MLCRVLQLREQHVISRAELWLLLCSGTSCGNSFFYHSHRPEPVRVIKSFYLCNQREIVRLSNRWTGELFWSLQPITANNTPLLLRWIYLKWTGWTTSLLYEGSIGPPAWSCKIATYNNLLIKEDPQLQIPHAAYIWGAISKPKVPNYYFMLPSMLLGLLLVACRIQHLLQMLEFFGIVIDPHKYKLMKHNRVLTLV